MAGGSTSMHYCMLFTFPKDKAANSLDARTHVDDYLAAEGFCSETRWACGIADWYVIGGRWSRLLTDTTARGKEFLAWQAAHIKEHYPLLSYGISGISYGDVEQRAAHE